MFNINFNAEMKARFQPLLTERPTNTITHSHLSRPSVFTKSTRNFIASSLAVVWSAVNTKRDPRCRLFNGHGAGHVTNFE